MQKCVIFKEDKLISAQSLTRINKKLHASFFKTYVQSWCGRRDLNPYGLPHAPQTCAYAYSATTACRCIIHKRYGIVKLNLRSRMHANVSKVLQLSVLCKVGFAGLPPRKPEKLLPCFLLQWIHQNGRQPLFLFPVPCSLFPVPCSLYTLSCNEKSSMNQNLHASRLTTSANGHTIFP